MWRNQMTGRPHQQLERTTTHGERHEHLCLTVHQVDVLRIHWDCAPGFRRWRIDNQMQMAA